MIGPGRRTEPAQRARRRRRARPWSAIPPTPCARAARPPRRTSPARSRSIIARRQAARRRHHLRLQRGAHQAPWPTPPERRARSSWWPGRAMHRIIDVAMETGYLPGNFKYHDQEHFSLPGAATRWCCCAPAARASRARRWPASPRTSIPTCALDKGDLVIFSSRTIPGNERAVGRIQNRLVDLGCEIVTDGDALVHVSGHPRREELKEMYGWVRPRIAIPMHGEARHLAEHAKLARAAGVKEVLDVRNGDMVRLAPGPAEIIDEAPVGRLFRDGSLLVPSEDGPVRERRSLAFAGIVIVALARSGRGELGRRRDRARRRAGRRRRGRADARHRARRGRGHDRQHPAATGAGTASWCAKPCGAPCARRVERRLGQAADCQGAADAAAARAARLADHACSSRRGGRAMIGRLNHVAIAVPSLAAAAAQYRDTLGAAGVRAACRSPSTASPSCSSTLPNTKIELLEPLGEGSPIAAFLRAQSRRRHPSSLLRGRRHPRRARPAQGRGRARAGRRRARRSARTASRCCSCIPRISTARWSSWSRPERA